MNKICRYRNCNNIISGRPNWMSWSNHGSYTGGYEETWQYDHIIPISEAKTYEEVIKLNHYTNFRPLCSKKNLEKSNNRD
jgi:5-methylcytosine-specific restriction endonuclease McrA